MALCAAVRRLSRRDLIKEGGACAALLALGIGAPAAASTAGGLTRRRRAVYEALVRALQTTPEAGLAHRGAAAATHEFAAWYAGQDAAVRTHADAVLDHLDVLGLAEATPRAGLRSLRGWREAGDGSPTPDEAVRCAVVACAMGLAGAAA